MKKYILFLIFVMISAAMFAQDTAVVDTTGGGVGGVFDGILQSVVFWITAALVILEAVARAIPSASNWAPLSNIVKLLNKILGILGPNKTDTGGKFVNKEVIEHK